MEYIMTKQVDLNQYTKFVEKVTSAESNNYDLLHSRINAMQNDHLGYNFSLLMTSAIGLGSETGEFQEIIKKILFQGKEFNPENVFHMKRELGDIFWYWTNACRALNLDPNDVIAENVDKLVARYPGGSFDVYYSENRKEGDL
jgi:NTP pyrophosphatase (non-canonical NTP hydrolase)